MSTMHDHQPPSQPPPPAPCWNCRRPLPRAARFCNHCGFKQDWPPAQPTLRSTDQGQPTWPPPAAILTPIARTPRSDELFQRPSFASVKSHPIEDSLLAAARRHLPQMPRPDTDWLRSDREGLRSLMPSGPLPFPGDADQQPPRNPPTAVGAATPEDELPDWLQNARTPSQPVPAVQPAKPDESFLLTSGKSVPLGEQPRVMVTDSDPTLRRIPLPDLLEPGQRATPPAMQVGMLMCQECHGEGQLFGMQPPYLAECPTCHGDGRVPDPASVTGPTDLALEAVQVSSLAQMPQITEPIEGIIEETEGPRRHVEDMLQEIAECITGVAAQAGNCVSRLDRQLDRLTDMIRRLEWMDSAELVLLGMTEDAARKTLLALRQAEASALEAKKHLCMVEMTADVALIHSTGWQDSYSLKRGE